MATDAWIANGTGNWTTASDWDFFVPGTFSNNVDPYIGNNTGTAVVTSSAEVVINTLQIRAGDELFVTGGAQNGGLFALINGTPEGNFGLIDVQNADFQVDNGTINNSGTIELTPTGKVGDANLTSDLIINNTVELNGAGSIVFGGTGNDGIYGLQASSKLINGDNNISGAGKILGILFTNYGTVETNNDYGAFTLGIWGSGFGGDFDNEGSVFADNGGTLQLGAINTNSSTIINNKLIEMRSDGAATYIQIVGNLTIQGSGQILLAGSSAFDDHIVSNGTSATLNLDGGLLSGEGAIGDAKLTLNIEAGTKVQATVSYLYIDTGSNTISNAGVMAAQPTTSGGTSILDISSTVENTGVILALNGGYVGVGALEPHGTLINEATGVIQAIGGSINFYTPITNNGGVIEVSNGGEIFTDSTINSLNGAQIEIGSGGLLDLQAGGTVSQGVQFTGSNAVLELDQNAGQIGTNISGATGGDSIDLKFLTFAAGDHAVWTQSDGTEGTVSVVNAAGSTLATLVLAGSWNSQEFNVTADSQGDVQVAVTNAAPTPPAIVAPSFPFTGDSVSQIETVYIAYYGRAGDPSGTDYWTTQLTTGNLSSQALTSIAASYSVQPESQAQYPFLANPLTASTSGTGNALDGFMNSVYENLFGRTADGTDTTGGLGYWRTQVLNALATHNSTTIANELGAFCLQVAFGAQSTDQTVLTNKVTVADFLTQTLVTDNVPYGNSGSTVDQLAHTEIAGVTASAASVTAAEVAITGIIQSLI